MESNIQSAFARTFYERVVCADGASVSIQAGVGIYCTPRDNRGPYSHVEAGFPSVPPPASWREYADGPPEEAEVYGYLPWSCVDEFISAHGGMVSGALPPRSQEA